MLVSVSLLELQSKMSPSSFYQPIDKDKLVQEFVGKSIKEVQTPAVVIDLAKAKPNCDRMLEASEKLGFGWRAHIKTHKVSATLHVTCVATLWFTYD